MALSTNLPLYPPIYEQQLLLYPTSADQRQQLICAHSSKAIQSSRPESYTRNTMTNRHPTPHHNQRNVPSVDYLRLQGRTDTASCHRKKHHSDQREQQVSLALPAHGWEQTSWNSNDLMRDKAWQQP